MTEPALFEPTVTLLQNPDVVMREVDEDGALLFNPDTNRVRVVNRTGLFIWNLCEKGSDLPSILSGLQKTFDQVPEAEVQDQVTAYVTDLFRSGFLGQLDEPAEVATQEATKTP
jgi:hypothetical protein